MAFDEVVDIVRRHTTPSHRWRALARALEACSRLAQDPPPICGLINDACDEGGGAVRVRGPAWVPRPLGACSLAFALGLLPGSAVAVSRRALALFVLGLFHHHTGEFQQVASR